MIGRPTEYKEEFVEDIIKYFDVEPFEVRTITHTKRNGESWETEEDVANPLPTLAGYAAKTGVHRDTLHEWSKKYPDFSDAIRRCKEMQYNMLVANGLKGLYAQPFAVFTAKNILGWTDRQETDITSGGEKLRSLIVYKPQKNES